VPVASPLADRVISILAIESDPVMQSGLITCLNRFPDLQVAAEAETTVDALKILTDRSSATISIDLILLGLPLNRDSIELSGLAFCQQVKASYPNLPILLLASPQEKDLMAAFQMGIAGCCVRGGSILDLVSSIRQVAAGQTTWAPEILQQLTFSTPTPAINPLRKLRLSSLKQIETALAEINTNLDHDRLSSLDRLILTGRKRELNTALWLVKRLLPTATPFSLKSAAAIPKTQSSIDSSQLVTTSTTEIAPTGKQTEIFDRIAAKLQSSLDNLTPTVLEIDILRQEKKRELFYLILRQFEGLLDELRFSQVTTEQLPAKQSAILQDLWASVTTDFLGRYNTVEIDNRQIEILPKILQDAAIIQSEILAKIPYPSELLNHLLFQQPLTINNAVWMASTPAAEDRACALLENLIISIANAVMQPLLNHFADLESMKTGFYDRRLLSSRDVERFRNDLSWRYRIDRYIGEPQAIFESQYRLFIFTKYGIERIAIYAPRPQELAQLGGIPLVVTLALETRDAISPRLKSATTFIGSSIVYLLTEIIGRGIGLIGRGVIKGVGNIWQESNRSRKE
jgi:DNA-binding NarL/FixJ family response regulator